MILDTIKSVAGTAGSAGVVWICVHYFVQLITVLATPVCTAVSIVMVARYASQFVIKPKPPKPADGNEVEKTKQREFELAKSKAEWEANAAIQQLCKIASAAGVDASKYSGIYSASDFNKIIEKVKA